MDFIFSNVRDIDDLKTLFSKIRNSTEYKLTIETVKRRILNLLSCKNKNDLKKNIIGIGSDDFMEKYNIKEFSKEIVLNNIINIQKKYPVIICKYLSEVIKIELDNFYLNSDLKKIVINIGEKTRLINKSLNGVEFDQWCNLLDSSDFNKIILTSHTTIKLDSNMQIINFNFTIKSEGLNYNYSFEDKEDKLFIYSKLLHNSHFKSNIETELKFEINNNQAYSFLSCIDKYNNKIETGKVTKLQDNKNNKIRILREFSKNELDNNYEEKHGEWYDSENNSDYSNGHKYFSNSNKRSLSEDWWRTQNYDFTETKISRELNDGLGIQTNEVFGFRENSGFKIYDFYDKTVHNIATGEITTKKNGYDRINKWNSYNFNTENKNLIENYCINYESEEEWFEKWYACFEEKYCFKWGKNKINEWEEEWKEVIFNPDYIEKNCYKKCKIFEENYQWYETWTEKYCINKNIVHKTCYKKNQNLNNNIKTEDRWSHTLPIDN